jgi:predicted O-methyltransferase YrrM
MTANDETRPGLVRRVLGRQFDSARSVVRGYFQLGFVEPPYDGMQNYTRMRFLYDMVLKHAPPHSRTALEVGVYGCSLVFLSKACLKRGITRIYGIDLFTGTAGWNQTFDTYEEAVARMRKYRLSDTVKLVRTDSQAYSWNEKIDVLHLDADHEYEAVRRDIEKYAPLVSEGGIIVFDDYDSSHPGVVRAVHELVGDNQFEVAGVNYGGYAFGSICLRRNS